MGPCLHPLNGIEWCSVLRLLVFLCILLVFLCILTLLRSHVSEEWAKNMTKLLERSSINPDQIEQWLRKKILKSWIEDRSTTNSGNRHVTTILLFVNGHFSGKHYYDSLELVSILSWFVFVPWLVTFEMNCVLDKQHWPGEATVQELHSKRGRESNWRSRCFFLTFGPGSIQQSNTTTPCLSTGSETGDSACKSRRYQCSMYLNLSRQGNPFMYYIDTLFIGLRPHPNNRG